MIRGHYASYDTSYFNLSNSIAYVASTIGSALSVSGGFAYDTITTVVLSWLLYLFQRK